MKSDDPNFGCDVAQIKYCWGRGQWIVPEGKAAAKWTAFRASLRKIKQQRTGGSFYPVPTTHQHFQSEKLTMECIYYTTLNHYLLAVT